MSRVSSKVNRILSLRRLSYSATGLLFGILTGIVTTRLTNSADTDMSAVPYLVAALAVCGLLSLIMFFRASETIKVVMQPPVIVRTPIEQERSARPGLIVFISLYNPFKSTTAKGLTKEQWLQAAAARDYSTLDILNSNLEIAIAAISAHASALKHCWLISTTAQGEYIAGSLPYAETVVAYLREKMGMQHCQFYRGAPYAIPLDDDALVCSKTYDLITQILKEAQDLGLSRKTIAADFTGCPRSMTLGMILATLSKDTNVQFMGTRYNAKASPEGSLFPVIFRFEPKVETDS